MAGYCWTLNFLLSPDGSESVPGLMVTRDFFKVIGIQPQIGRLFLPSDIPPTNAQPTVVILGHELWQRRFHGDSNIIGQVIHFNSSGALTVVGVMPPNLRVLPSPMESHLPSYDANAHVDYWLPASPDDFGAMGTYWAVAGRLRDGARLEAAQAGMIVPTLVGPKEKICNLAGSLGLGLDLEGIDVIDAPHSQAAAEKVVELVRTGKAEMLMKGSLHSDELLSAVTKREAGLRTARRISHVFVMDVPTHPQTLFITDAAVNIAPDLEAKRDIIQNAIDLYVGLGLGTPRVAILSAVETVTARIPSTIEAAALCKMADRGQITGGELDGPLAFDNAISPEAARIKGIKSSVAGRAQILVVPDMEAGNMLAKNLTFLSGADAAGIVLGARAPIILTSRADNVRTRMASCAVAMLFAHSQRAKTPVRA